jgi:cysteinyl-tRNA synthetase
MIMALKLYNTLSRTKEEFKPLKEGFVGLYTCGPTVYDFAHIGNLRTYIFEDVLKRVLERAYKKVNHIMNITDVDDKTIAGAKKAGIELRGFTLKYEKAFKEDLEKLNIKLPTKLLRATENIEDMKTDIKKLVGGGFAYEKDSSVYFDVSKFKTYGNLSRLDKKGLKVGARMDSDEYEKGAMQDFALWKRAKDHEPSWDSPYGKGRPGWHIECSVMATKELGQTFDIHAGAIDLLFPHHENEIAQAEAISGEPFVRYWLHGEHLLVDGKKMSKSLGNIYTLRDLKEKGFSPLDFRMLLLGTHYRSKLNFTWESLRGAKTELDRLRHFSLGLRLMSVNEGKSIDCSPYLENFFNAVHDDLNIPAGLGILWTFIKDIRKSKPSNKQDISEALEKFESILGVKLNPHQYKIPDSITQLGNERDLARKEKDWAKADMIREKLLGEGYMVSDNEESSMISPIDIPESQ